MRKLLIGLAVLLSLAVIAVLVGPGFVDWTRYKPTIERQLTALFGRAVAIEGAVDFAVLPTPILTAEGVRVAGPTPEAAPMLEIGALEARVAFAPLLSGTLQVERIALQRPVVTIRTMPGGGTSWSGVFGREGGASSVRLDRVTIDDGRVVLRDRDGQVILAGTRIFGQVAAETLAGPFEALGSVTVHDRALTFDLETGRLSEAGTLPATLRLGIDGADAEARYAGLVGGGGRLQGEVRVSGSDLAALLARLAPQAAALPPGLDRRFVLEGRVDGSAAAIQLNAMTAEIGAARATGAASIVPGPVPQIDVALAAGRIDVDAWRDGAPGPGGPPAGWLSGGLAQGLAGGLAGGLAETLAETLADLERTAPDLTRRVALTLDASIDAAQWRGGLVRRIGLTATLADGRLAVSRLSAALPGSTSLDLEGRIGAPADAPADAPTDGPPAEARVTAVSEDLRGLLDWLDVPAGRVPPGRLRRAQVTATVTAGAEGIAIDGLGGELDGTAFSGAARWRPAPHTDAPDADAPNAGAPDAGGRDAGAQDGGVAGLGLRLQVGRLNLDGYLPEEVRPAHPAALAGALVARLRQPPAMAATVELGVEHLTLAGREMAAVALDGRLSGGGVLRLDGLSIGRLGGAGLSMSGRLAPARPAGDGPLPPIDLSFTADAEDAGRLAERLGLAVPGAVARLGPARLEGRIAGSAAALDLDAEVAALDGTLAVGGRIEDPAGRPAYDLALRLILPEARPLAAAVAPGWRPRGPLGDIDLYTVLTGGPAMLTFGDIQGRAAGTALAGTLALRRGAERPAIEVDLRTGALDLSPLLPTPGMPALPGGAGPRWSSARWPLGWLSAVDARLSLTGEALALGSWRLAAPAARAALEDGVLTVERMSGGLFDGRLAFDGRYDTAAEPAALRGSLALTGAPLAVVLAELVGEPAVEGTMDFRFDGTAAGRSPASLVATLEGAGLAAVRDGALIGLDLEEIGRRLAGLEEPLDFLPILREAIGTGRTGFDALNLPYTVSGGVARTEELRIAARAGEGAGAGSLDLSRGRIDLGVDFTVARLPEAPAFGVRLIGPVEDPGLRLETEALQAFLARRAAEALVEEE